MSVARVTEIISSSKKSFEDAIEKGINRAAKTLIRCKRLRRTPLRARARETSHQHLLNRGERSPLPTYFEVVNRRIATFSQRKTDPFHDEIMDFAAFMEGRLPQSLIHSF
jgi:hypothetical protein